MFGVTPLFEVFVYFDTKPGYIIQGMSMTI